MYLGRILPETILNETEPGGADMMEDGLMLASLLGVSVHTIATLAVVVLGNILPAGVILSLWWYAAKHERHAGWPEPPRPASARIYRHAA
jgi:hypothetical protein